MQFTNSDKFQEIGIFKDNLVKQYIYISNTAEYESVRDSMKKGSQEEKLAIFTIAVENNGLIVN